MRTIPALSRLVLPGLQGRNAAARSAGTVGVGSLLARVYSTPGPGPASPVFVLLHGIGTSHRYFRRLQEVLAGYGDTHSIDLPGFGATPKPEAQVTVAEYAAVIGTILDGLGPGPYVLVGHSMGTQFATELALQRPGLVSHVVLMGPVVDSAHRTVLRQALALGLDTLRESPAGNALVFTDYLRCGPRWYLAELPVMLTYDIEAQLRKVIQPVLVLRGARDPVAGRSWCLALAGTPRNGRFLEIPGQPHLVQHGAAARTAAGILTLVRE